MYTYLAYSLRAVTIGIVSRAVSSTIATLLCFLSAIILV